MIQKENEENAKFPKQADTLEGMADAAGPDNLPVSRGGTTNMDAESTIANGNTTHRGSGLTSKKNVTGSDFDGQPA